MGLIVSIAFYFKQAISANFDLFYIIGFFVVMKDLIKDNGILFIKSFCIMWLIIIYAVLQIILIKDIIFIKLFVNVMKIWIGFLLFIYVKENINKIPIRKIVDYSTYLFIISIPICLVFKNSILWNDSGNLYSKVRLQLFFYEPSALAYQLTVLTIFAVYYLFNSKNRKDKRKYVTFIFALSILIYFSKSLTGFLCIAISLASMYIAYAYQNKSFKILALNVFTILLSSLFLFIFLRSNSPISLRLLDVISGNDTSFSYRLFGGYSVMTNALNNTNLLGIGFGNLNTAQVALNYGNYGLIGVISNSFMYFITEGGICAIVYLFFIIGYLIKNVHKNKSILKIGLFVFIITTQIPGGYFTDPMNWIIYGIICSKSNL